MSEASFAELLEDSLVTIHNGEIVEGTVIGVKDNEIILNIGYKADGILTKNVFRKHLKIRKYLPEKFPWYSKAV